MSYEYVDCSGLIKLGLEDVPGLRRSQAWAIFVGNDGYVGRIVGVRDVEDLDLVVFKFPRGLPRPLGINHIGVLWYNPASGLLELMHASGSRGGVFVEPLVGRLLEHVFAYKRLTIGD